jgi:hypothetical protein
MLVAANTASPFAFEAATEVPVNTRPWGVVIPGIAIGVTMLPVFLSRLAGVPA